MQIEFYKYQGTGNDFVMIDNRSGVFPKENVQLIAHLCDRRFGIGGDGLILLEHNSIASNIALPADFRMVYYNSDGNQGSMCGNGGRCTVAFAKKLRIIEDDCMFMAADGWHIATITENGLVSLKMIEVSEVTIKDDYVFLNTGSPHHVQMVDDLENYNIKEHGSSIRYGKLYGAAGSNINFVKQIDADTFSIRTYERGVEDETLSCGTGATAVAIAMNATGKTNSTSIHLNVEGGKLEVTFDKEGDQFTNVFLIGPAEFVFKGGIEI